MQKDESGETGKMNARDRLETMGVLALAIVAACVLVPLVVLVFAIALLWHEPRIPVGIALGLLVVTAITLAAGGKGVAEELAVWAYSLLALGVVLMLVKHVTEIQRKAE